MAIQNAIVVETSFICDGTSNTASLDLTKDPYSLNGNIINWFASQNKVTQPTSAFSPDTRFTATLVGNILTFVFATVPPAGPTGVIAYILF